MAELRGDNKQLVASMREVHAQCDEHGDVATAIESWIDDAERRVWFVLRVSADCRREPHLNWSSHLWLFLIGAIEPQFATSPLSEGLPLRLRWHHDPRFRTVAHSLLSKPAGEAHNLTLKCPPGYIGKRRVRDWQERPT